MKGLVKVKYQEEFEFEVDISNEDLQKIHDGEFPYVEEMLERSMHECGEFDEVLYDEKGNQIWGLTN